MKLNTDRLIQITIAIFVLLTIWWIALNLLGERETMHNYLFGATYGIMALLGGYWGIQTAFKWGWTKSVMGRAIIALSAGLFAEEFGQIVFSYYNIFLQVQTPYPSLADLGFFGNIPLYFIGISLLSKAAGVQFTLKKALGKLAVLLIPIFMLASSYYFFLLQYEFDFTNILKIFLDFGYPLGQALYISIAILTYVLTRGVLGGIMRNKILLLLWAFIAQYMADYNFLFQSSRGTWYNAGYGDYMYLVAYFIMTLGLLQLRKVILELHK